MKKLFLLILIFCLATPVISAQDSTAKVKKRHQKSFLAQDRPWTVELPLWIPGFRGEFAYGDIDLEGEDGGDPGDPGDPGDGDECGVFCRLFNTKADLKFFFSTRITYDKNRFALFADAFTVELGESVRFNYNDKEIVQANTRAILARVYAGYGFYEHMAASQKSRFNLHAYGGIRIHSFKITSDLNDAINELDIHPVWTGTRHRTESTTCT